MLATNKSAARKSCGTRPALAASKSDGNRPIFRDLVSGGVVASTADCLELHEGERTAAKTRVKSSLDSKHGGGVWGSSPVPGCRIGAHCC
ncbi:unnamed protein product [Linum trigynum]|uniref:Uncharacterized protein n=1 Tax=Linum trigynum TaxID=586398 RepID=A0AAV2FAV9_9ROSI